MKTLTSCFYFKKKDVRTTPGINKKSPILRVFNSHCKRL